MPARVLIIEDNPANLELMSYLLRSSHHTILAAGDGQEGIGLAVREKPDLIICDIHLPDFDGYAVVTALMAHPEWRPVPLVAVTALAMVGDRDRVLAGGFDGYLSKPIDPETFVQQLETYLPSRQADKRAQTAETL